MEKYDEFAPQAAKWLLADGTITDKLPVAGAGGDGDMLKEEYDTNDDGKVDAAETAHSVPWSGVTRNPSSYPSTIADVSGLQTALDEKSDVGHTHSQYLDASMAADPGDIADPTAASAEDVANKINTLLANLRAAGIIG